MGSTETISLLRCKAKFHLVYTDFYATVHLVCYNFIVAYTTACFSRLLCCSTLQFSAILPYSSSCSPYVHYSPSCGPYVLHECCPLLRIHRNTPYSRHGCWPGVPGAGEMVLVTQHNGEMVQPWWHGWTCHHGEIIW